MTAPVQPLYADQLRTMLEAFAPGQRQDRDGLLRVLRILMENARADDDTDKKLDWYSIALFMSVAHNLLPGLKAGLPVDPGVVSELEGRFAEDFPMLHVPRLVERQFNWVFEDASFEFDAGQDLPLPPLALDLLARVGVASYLLETAGEEDGMSFEAELDAFLTIAVAVLHDFQSQGKFHADWELPPLA